MKITIEIDDNELEEMFNSKSKETEEKCEGEEKKSTDYGVSQYARVFDPRSKYWINDPRLCRIFLQYIERWANDMLKMRKRLYLNDVYEQLGISKTQAGQVVGWLYHHPVCPHSDNFVDFGLNDDRNSDFMDGKTSIAVLDFNVDGDITQYRYV